MEDYGNHTLLIQVEGSAAAKSAHIEVEARSAACFDSVLEGWHLESVYVIEILQSWTMEIALWTAQVEEHLQRWLCRASCPRMSVDILGTKCDQC